MLEFSISLIGIGGQDKLNQVIDVLKQEGAEDVKVERQDAEMLEDPNRNTGIVRAIIFARGDWSRGEIDSFLDRLKDREVFAEF